MSVNPKRYIGIDWYSNISFYLLNRYGLLYKIDFLTHNQLHFAKIKN